MRSALLVIAWAAAAAAAPERGRGRGREKAARTQPPTSVLAGPNWETLLGGPDPEAAIGALIAAGKLTPPDSPRPTPRPTPRPSPRPTPRPTPRPKPPRPTAAPLGAPREYQHCVEAMKDHRP